MVFFFFVIIGFHWIEADWFFKPFGMLVACSRSFVRSLMVGSTVVLPSLDGWISLLPDWMDHRCRIRNSSVGSAVENIPSNYFQ